jgi:wobble nucleotide-excising tRNase
MINEWKDLSDDDWQRVTQMLEQALKGQTCPFCQTAITRRVQRGRCVYAHPCGCRLYQGRVRKDPPGKAPS